MMGSINYITTIINMRAPGMTLFRMPLTIWALFITAILQLLALPVLTVGAWSCCSSTARSAPTGSIPSGGGEPLLWQHLFWFFAHPAVYIMILPAMGMVSDILSRSRASRSSATADGLLDPASRSCRWIVWGHHMFSQRHEPRARHDVHASPR